MSKHLKFFLRLLWSFGIYHGIRIFIYYYFVSQEVIKLPNIQYPFYLRRNSTDYQIFYHIFLCDEYNIPFCDIPEIIIDGGANTGLFSVMMKNKFPDAKIICVEPDLENFEMVKKNLSRYNDIVYANCGLWHKDTKLKVYDKYDAGKWGMVVEEDSQLGDIDSLSISTLMNNNLINRIDILKLDIETSEKVLFSANYDLWLPRVKMIIIELHDRFEPGCSKAFFTAINNTYKNYSYSHCGENVVIINMDL